MYVKGYFDVYKDYTNNLICCTYTYGDEVLRINTPIPTMLVKSNTFFGDSVIIEDVVAIEKLKVKMFNKLRSKFNTI